MSRDVWLRLAFAGLHPDRCRALLDQHGDPQRVVDLLTRSGDRSEESAAVLPAAECSARLTDLGVSFDVAGEKDFPARLAVLPDGPRWLFRRGPPVREPGVAIVGTRRCTAYGRRLARSFGEACATAGWGVVSGLARGIDGAAHEGVVDARGRAIAVLGSGPDIRYPREHTRLHQQILDGGGTVITEYPPGTPPLGWRFPPRNRIISGMSAAVVVVESAVTGGSLGTAQHALAQDRFVFAVPGDVDREASVGCNLLIRDGATPVLGADDLLESLSLLSELGAPSG